MARELADAALERRNHGLGEAWFIKIDDVLNHIVSKRILHKYSSMLRDAPNEPGLLFARSVINATLEHTAPVPVRAHLDTVIANRIEDELRIERCKLVQALLDDVVAVKILNELDNTEAKGFNDKVHLLWSANVFDHLL